MKQSYSKPAVTRIELKPVEALLYACKASNDIGTGFNIVNGACIPAHTEACRDSSGS